MTCYYLHLRLVYRLFLSQYVIQWPGDGISLLPSYPYTKFLQIILKSLLIIITYSSEIFFYETIEMVLKYLQKTHIFKLHSFHSLSTSKINLSTLCWKIEPVSDILRIKVIGKYDQIVYKFWVRIGCRLSD